MIIRTFDSASTLATAIASVRGQTEAAEVIVVDSGSSDDTCAIAEQAADKVLHVKREDFTYGRALNIGAREATGVVHCALSSHCAFPINTWIEIAVHNICDLGAAATFGPARGPSREWLHEPLHVTWELAFARSAWGYSNHAGAWAAASWREHPFNEDIEASEDREWSLRMLREGGFMIADPRLLVPATHRRAAGANAYRKRLVKEYTALLDIRPLPPFSLPRAAMEFVRNVPSDPFLSDARPRGRTRLIEVIARWEAGRVAREFNKTGGARGPA